jgi:hypothetical protein
MKQKNPKARRSCFGIHTEPCVNYHQTLFAVGRSHTCKAYDGLSETQHSLVPTDMTFCRCVANEAAHFQRHSAIARLVNEWHSCNHAGQNTPVRRKEKSHRQESGGDRSTHNESTTTNVSSSDPRTISEEKAASFDAKENFQSPSERRALKKTMKDQQNQERAFRNQQKFDPSVTQAQVDRVARVIHGAQHNVDGIGGRPMAEANINRDMLKRDQVFNPALKDHVAWLKKQVKVSRTRNGKRGVDAQKKQEDEDTQNGLPILKDNMAEAVSNILMQLGLPSHNSGAHSHSTYANPSANRSKKQHAGLLQQLRKEITADIEKSNNDSRAKQQRKEGYWRYINGTITERLAQNDQLVDRATGMRLKGEDNHRHRPAQALEMGQGGAGVVGGEEVEDQEVEEGV